MKRLKQLTKLKLKLPKSTTIGIEHSDLVEFRDNKVFDNFLKIGIEKLSKIIKEAKFNSKFSEEELILRLNENVNCFDTPHLLDTFITIYSNGPWELSLSGNIFYQAGGLGRYSFGYNPEFLINKMKKDFFSMDQTNLSLIKFDLLKELESKIGSTRVNSSYYKYSFFQTELETFNYFFKLINENTNKNLKEKKFKSVKKIIFKKSLIQNRLLNFNDDDFILIDCNNHDDLEKIFKHIKKKRIYIEACFIDSLVGVNEFIDPDFYLDLYDRLKENNSLIIVDSSNTSLRANGNLSIIDNPGFAGLPMPDIELFSNSLTSGSFPLLIAGLNEEIVNIIFQQTSLNNQYSLLVAKKVLSSFDQEVKENIINTGSYLNDKFINLVEKFPEYIIDVKLSGLFINCLFKSNINLEKFEGIIFTLNKSGLKVSKGNNNSIQITPWFYADKKEIDLIIKILEKVLYSELFL